METREHWWNGNWGTGGRRDVWLRYNGAGGLWEVEARRAGRSTLGEFATEDEARDVLTKLVAGTGWRRLDDLSRPEV
ncbi:hypothetical protein Val02_69260 [Virgisporangium aliadipatigenens]|uniref:Uncharacterized protein n=1 Tax=Virgisporangium aliadipatigenens TaxID=741659 RepID=A0A8J3YUE4_9ACTN|nr:hypothetical protein [Virgisporangium aliadipatigenens]GIJ50040.1 hypothetical protein Val02_69260 [Virgisporangium aliadipatigenens]